jgi:hypothetical protein
MKKRIYNLMPEPIKYDLSTRLPSLVSLGCNTKSNESHRARVFERGGVGPRGFYYKDDKLDPKNVEEYVKTWDRLNGLTPNPITWVKVDYHFG